MWPNHAAPTGRCSRNVAAPANQKRVRGGDPEALVPPTNGEPAACDVGRAVSRAGTAACTGVCAVGAPQHGLSNRPPGQKPPEMLSVSGLSVALALVLLPASTEALKEGECEVCIAFLGRFYDSLKDNEVAFNNVDIEKALTKSCNDAKGKENRFCYYIGATSDAATKMINEVSKPMSHHVPVEKICEKLKKKDSQICELKYDKQLDLSTVDLKKLKVKDLKKVLEDWGESCKGCAEKSDFIRKITELMPKYAPAAARARTEL